MPGEEIVIWREGMNLTPGPFARGWAYPEKIVLYALKGIKEEWIIELLVHEVLHQVLAKIIDNDHNKLDKIQDFNWETESFEFFRKEDKRKWFL